MASDNLDHTKEAADAFMLELFIINKEYSSITFLKVFTDRPTSQFKQRFFVFKPSWMGK